jgi:hypothetical protein
MANKKKTAASNGTTSAQGTGENLSAYFRKVFGENPRLIDSRSNEELLQRWLTDHPGEKEVPERVRQNLSNIKSVLRQKGRKKKLGRPKKDAQTTPTPTTAPVETPRKTIKGLDTLEEHIDDCLSLAKHLDREGLANVIALLRRARNEVVWKMGM